MISGYDRVAALIFAARETADLTAERHAINSNCVVSVEIVNDVPLFFIDNQEVTASRAVEALEAI